MQMRKTIVTAGLLTLGLATAALAQDAAPVVEAASEAEAAVDVNFYVFNTLLFFLGGILVMWMAAGFCMLEAGLVRSKNVSMQCLKNISLYSIGVLVYWIVGYNLMYTGVDGGWFGTPSWMVFPSPAEDTGDYSLATDFFYQSMFCATAASIVSGTVGFRLVVERFDARAKVSQDKPDHVVDRVIDELQHNPTYGRPALADEMRRVHRP